MWRTWFIVGLFITAASAAAYQSGSHWKKYHFAGSRLMADLAHPDALIRTTSLSKLPHDLLEIPIARDVLTEDLAFYYEQDEDRLGLEGAIRRIAYEHQLNWTDRIMISVFDEPAEIALWRDGKGALRNYAIVMRRNSLTKVLQEAASVALDDQQLKRAGEIETSNGKAMVFALEINPRRTLLLVSQGDRLVVLSDPGLLFNANSEMVPAARDALIHWLNSEGALARQFSLDGDQSGTAITQESSIGRATHTLVIGAPTIALGYSAFMPGFKGVRFDYDRSWSTSLWIDPKKIPTAGLGDSALWRAVPANPSACVLLPIDWNAVRNVVSKADMKQQQPDAATLAALDGAAVACWYSESTLYSPVFITRLSHDLPQRNIALQALASWAINKGGADDEAIDAKTAGGKSKNDIMVWHATGGKAEVGARGAYVVFSPDGALVDKVLDTISRANPSVVDQMPITSATLALMTPRPLSAMAEREVLQALSDPDDADLLAAAQSQLPARMQALARNPAYRLELSGAEKSKGGWQHVEWRTLENNK